LVDQYAPTRTRSLDVAIGAFGTVQNTYELTLPAGFGVVSAPDAVDISSRFGKYSIQVEQTPGRVTVQSAISLSVNRVSASDYPAWRAFCQAVDNAMSVRLVVGN
jgi:hypothetical protein